MSDEIPLSSHGLPPDPRGTNTPPAWWSTLWRSDLPDDRGQSGGRAHRGDSELEWLMAPDDGDRGVPGLGAEIPSRGRAWLTLALLSGICAALLAIGTLGSMGTAYIVVPLVALVVFVGALVVCRR